MTKPKKDQLVGFQADEEMKGRIRERARHTADGNVSAHLRQLAVKDLDADAKKPKTYDANVLEHLAQIYAGYVAPTLASQLGEEKADQPKILHDLLCGLSEGLACGYKSSDLVIAPKILIKAGSDAAWPTDPELNESGPGDYRPLVAREQRGKEAQAAKTATRSSKGAPHKDAPNAP